MDLFLSPDPVITQEIIGNYTVFLLDGNTLDSLKVRAGTVVGYLRAVNKHYKRNHTHEPFNKDDESDAAVLVRDQEKFEKKPDKRNPLTNAMCLKMCQLAKEDKDSVGFRSAAWDWTALGRYGGFRAQEFCMEKSKKIRYYAMPDGTLIVRAFVHRNFTYYDGEGTRMDDELALRKRRLVQAAGQIYDVQKNRQNGQEITQARLQPNPELDAGPCSTSDLCPVRRSLSIKTRANVLGHTDPEDPLCVYRKKCGDVVYLTGTDMTEYYRFVLRLVQPSVTDDEVSLISTHSLRVCACVLLHEAGKDGPYIKIRLRWLSNCYEVYLRNTETIRQQHSEAMAGSNAMMAKLVLDAAEARDIVQVREDLDMDDLEDDD